MSMTVNLELYELLFGDFFICNIKLNILTLLNCAIQWHYIHNVVQLSPLTICRTFHHPNKNSVPVKHELPIPLLLYIWNPLWMKNVACISVNKECCGHHVISPCSCPAAKPWENSGWTQTSCQPLILATAASPQWCILRGFRMGKSKIQALDNYNAYQRNDFSESRLSHLPIHRKALNSLT